MISIGCIPQASCSILRLISIEIVCASRAKLPIEPGIWGFSSRHSCWWPDVTSNSTNDLRESLKHLMKSIQYFQSSDGIIIPDSKVHGSHMGPIWCRQAPGGPRIGPMNFVIWDTLMLVLPMLCRGTGSFHTAWVVLLTSVPTNLPIKTVPLL